MTSAIDPTKPTSQIAYTQDVRNNFQAAKTEIESLQTDKLSVSNGGTINGPLTVTKLNVSNLPQSNPDGSPPAGSVKGDLYINGGFVCIAP